MTRPTADIIADLRRPGSVVEWWMKAVRREAADRLAELDACLDAVSVVLAEDHHPDRSDGWWDGYIELSDRLKAILSQRVAS